MQNTKVPEVVEQCCLVQPCFCRYHEYYHLVINTPAGGAWSEMAYIAQVVENTFPKSEEMFSGLMIRLE